MKRRVTILLIGAAALCALVATPASVHVWTSFENGSVGDTVTKEMLEAGTIKHAANGYWTNIGADHFKVAGSNYNAGGSIRICSTNFVDSGTRGISFLADVDLTYAQYVLNSDTVSNLAIGCWLGISSYTNYSFSTYDILMIAGSGEFLAANLDDKPGAQYMIRTHTHAGGSTGMRVATNGLYWITMLWAADAMGKIALYNSNLVAIETNELYLLPRNAKNIILGRGDNHGSTNNSVFTYDNLLIDTNGDWPLLPGHRPRMNTPTVNAGSIVLK